ncbi:MAG: OmpA family protein [Treponema sp.]|nr:OmpA family protein [Treponema sp.]
MKKTLGPKFPKKRIIVLFTMVTLASGLYAQTAFPGDNFWSMDVGFGMTGIFVEGKSYQGIINPKFWFSPPLMIGSRLGVGMSTDDILSFEGQVYLRWNFLRKGSAKKPVNVFIQSGLGMLAAYRGADTPFSDVTQNRGSLMADAALGITIPLTSRWHIEPSIRGGYPHIAGFSITTGLKIPWSSKAKYDRRSPNEIIRNMLIATVEHIMFGPDIGQYNAGVDRDTQRQNELILNNLAQMLVENPSLRLRIEGHANPVTYAPGEAERLMSLSKVRADTIASLLKEKGVSEEQMVIIAFGGARTITNDYDVRNRNRRVELIVIRVDA